MAGAPTPVAPGKPPGLLGGSRPAAWQVSPDVARVVDWVPRRPGLGLSAAADVDALGEWLSLSEPQASYL